MHFDFKGKHCRSWFNKPLATFNEMNFPLITFPSLSFWSASFLSWRIRLYKFNSWSWKDNWLSMNTASKKMSTFFSLHEYYKGKGECSSNHLVTVSYINGQWFSQVLAPLFFASGHAQHSCTMAEASWASLIKDAVTFTFPEGVHIDLTGAFVS